MKYCKLKPVIYHTRIKIGQPQQKQLTYAKYTEHKKNFWHHLINHVNGYFNYFAVRIMKKKLNMDSESSNLELVKC